MNPYGVMAAFYALAFALFITGIVRARGAFWETSWRWMVAGWAAYAVGLVFFFVGAAA